ncbi:MAG: hypothetical protein DSY83_10660 [Flavobacteriia bacterium]|nr:MAG: hypothetical protein DSY83_10660 [Flavobacteriia bacterium]
MPKKILIICSYANSLIHFRGDFIADLLKNGFMVYGAAPDMSQEIHSKLTEMGAIPLEYQSNSASDRGNMVSATF